MHLNSGPRKLVFLQAIRAKAIAEGRIHGPRAKQQLHQQTGPAEYEPFDFPDGVYYYYYTEYRADIVEQILA